MRRLAGITALALPALVAATFSACGIAVDREDSDYPGGSGDAGRSKNRSGDAAAYEGGNLPGAAYAFPHEDLHDIALSVSAGQRARIYDPSHDGKAWYVNDHTFARGPDGVWHLFGITREEPADPFREISFAHATSAALTSPTWSRQPDALVAATGESFIWAPHVVHNPSDGLYYMFYAAGVLTNGDADHRRFKMKIATSPDLMAWTRGATLFEDGFDGRDPFVTKIGNQWVVYYTATFDPGIKQDHLVAYRTSADLVTWGPRQIAFRDHASGGGDGDETESPQVLQRGDDYYLFLSIRSFYDSTDVLKSKDPFHFTVDQSVGHIDAHAGEVVRDTNGALYFSHAGWARGGVHLAPLELDGDPSPAARGARIATSSYRMTIAFKPRAEILSFEIDPTGSAPYAVTADRAPVGTAPYLAVGGFGPTDKTGPATGVSWQNDGRRLVLTGIPMGKQPVTVDWTFDFGDDTVDLSLVWHVKAATTVWETAMAFDTSLPFLRDDDGPRRDGDVPGFPEWSASSNDAVGMIAAYKTGSAFRAANRYYNVRGHYVAWQSNQQAGGTTWPAGDYKGGTWRIGGVTSATLAARATTLHAAVNGSP